MQRSPQRESALAVHNDGLRSTRTERSKEAEPATKSMNYPRTFSAQGYLRYQGDKFVSRFDANCYIHITRKMDTHDIGRGRARSGEEEEDESAAVRRELRRLPHNALVIGIQTDGLFMPSEQREIAEQIVGGTLVMIDSQNGHDGFLLEFEQINSHVMAFLRGAYPELYDGWEEREVNFRIEKTSMFGEAESALDVTMW